MALKAKTRILLRVARNSKYATPKQRKSIADRVRMLRGSRGGVTGLNRRYLLSSQKKNRVDVNYVPRKRK